MGLKLGSLRKYQKHMGMGYIRETIHSGSLSGIDATM